MNNRYTLSVSKKLLVKLAEIQKQVKKMSQKSLLKSVMAVLVVCAALSIVLCSVRGMAMADKACYTRDGASFIAERFVKNDNTFKFDGLRDTLSIRVEHANSLEDIVAPKTLGLTMIMAMPSGAKEYTFKAKFDCRHSGYGDRTGKYLAEVITPHEAVITVENCNVKSAIMDGKWDMVSETTVAST